MPDVVISSAFMVAATAFQPFLLGGIAGVIATTVVQPVDYLKTRVQLAGEGARGPAASPAAIARDTWRTAGARGFYAGVSAAWARQIVYGSARLGLFRVSTDALREAHAGAPPPVWQRVCVGLVTGAAASVLGNPADLALVRMQADAAVPPAQRRGYTGVFNAVARIVREEGVATLWRGSTPTVVRAALLNAAMLVTAERVREGAGPALGGPDSTAALFVSSAVAGVAAAVASLPADLIKTRLMKQARGPDGRLPYAGFADAAVKIVRAEGPASLYRGLGTYVLRIGPHAFITLVALQALTDGVNRWRRGPAPTAAAVAAVRPAEAGPVGAGTVHR